MRQPKQKRKPLTKRLAQFLILADQPGGHLDELLKQCRKVDPQWFDRLRHFSSFRRLIDYGVSEPSLLRTLAYIRLNSANKVLRTNAARFGKAATQMVSAARALEQLPDLAPSTMNLIEIASLATAIQAINVYESVSTVTRWEKIPASIEANLDPLKQAFLEVLSWILSPKNTAAALRSLAARYEALDARLKTIGPVRDSARDLFQLLVPAVVEGQSGRPHHEDVADLYGFVFDSAPPSPSDFARLKRIGRSKGR